MGELPGDIEERLMPGLTSANIACGGHCGDEHSMRRTVALAVRYGVSIGAHPSYSDRANFGRVRMNLEPGEIEESVFDQIAALGRVAAIRHVKPHGALYNAAAKDVQIAEAIGRAAARWSRDVVLVGLAGSVMLDAWRAAGFKVAAEGFADRRYEADGTLRPRTFPDALIHDPAEAAEQAFSLVQSGGVDTICIHSDTPEAVQILEAVRERFTASGVEVRALRR
jgi:UPF0271 protein